MGRKRKAEGADDGRAPNKSRRVERIDARKGLDNAIVPSPLRLGVVTWNVEHFGGGKLDISGPFENLRRLAEEYEQAGAATASTAGKPSLTLSGFDSLHASDKPGRVAELARIDGPKTVDKSARCCVAFLQALHAYALWAQEVSGGSGKEESVRTRGGTNPPSGARMKHWRELCEKMRSFGGASGGGKEEAAELSEAAELTQEQVAEEVEDDDSKGDVAEEESFVSKREALWRLTADRNPKPPGAEQDKGGGRPGGTCGQVDVGKGKQPEDIDMPDAGYDTDESGDEMKDEGVIASPQKDKAAAMPGLVPERERVRELYCAWRDHFAECEKVASEALKEFFEVWAPQSQAQQIDLQDIDSLDALLHDLAVALKQLRRAYKTLTQPAAQLSVILGMVKTVSRPGQTAGAGARISQCLDSRFYDAVIALDRAFHRVAVARHIVLMFKWSGWLKVAVLQEVNQGMGTLAEYLEEHGLECMKGPRLKSDSGQSSQIEYYPLVMRKHSDELVRVLSYFAASGGSFMTFQIEGDKVAPKGKGDEKGSDDHVPQVLWNKRKGRFRPIVGYDLVLSNADGGQHRVRIAAVHTSPAGREFERSAVFSQIAQACEALASAASAGLPTIVGGDFYLTAEALTVLQKELGAGPRAAFDSEVEAEREKLTQRIEKLQNEERHRSIKILELVGDSEAAKSERAKLKEELGEIHKELEDAKRQRLYIKFDLFKRMRNDERLVMTVGHRLRQMGFEVHQPLTGTNWKTKGKISEWDGAQIADFFISAGKAQGQRSWRSFEVGIVDPSGRVLLADHEELSIANYWRVFSDHFPVGGLFSTGENDDWVASCVHSPRPSVDASGDG